jgi:predicted RNA-binding protein associated with RNAse of E/G family
VEVLDEQKLQKSLKEGLITPSLFDEAERVKERVVEDVKD